MSIKTIFAMIFALLAGIGGTSAYFYFQNLDNALNASPAPPVRIEQAQKDEKATAPPINANKERNPKVTPINKGSLKEEDLVVGGVAYGASIDSVKAAHGEPYKIENKHKWRGNTPVSVYDYASLFDVYVSDGVVRCVKVERSNSLSTNKNISVGSSVDDVIAAYGEPNIKSKDKIIYLTENNPSLGIEFEIDYDFVEEIKVGLIK